MAEWTLWLGEELLAPLPHRQMVSTVPKRLRHHEPWKRKLLGHLARAAAARTATAFMRTALDESAMSVGIAISIQPHGFLPNLRRHVLTLVPDGGFRPDGAFARMPAHSTDPLADALLRGVPELIVARELFEPEVAEGML